MPDTKARAEIDEAKILAGVVVNLGLRCAAHQVGTDRDSAARELARAVLSLSAPGAQYRAGMERAAEIACKISKDLYGSKDICEVVDMIEAELAALPAPTIKHAPPDKLICRERGGSVDVTGACRLCGSWEGEACGQKLSQVDPNEPAFCKGLR